MFVVELAYTQPWAAVEAQASAHREFLQRMTQAGTFLLAGRKATGDGGIALANADSLQELEEFDLIAVGRALISDAHWVRKVASGQEQELRGLDAAGLAALA